MLWFSEHLHLGDEGRVGAQGRAQLSVGDLFTPSLGFAEVSRRHGDEGRAGAQGRTRMSVGDLFTPSLGFADVWRAIRTFRGAGAPRG